MKRLFLAFIAGLMIAGCDTAKETPEELSMNAGQQAVSVMNQNVASDSYAEGVELLQAGKINEAVQSFVQAIRENPENPQPYVTLGQIYLRMENYGEAVQAFTAASRVAPDRGDIYYFLALAHGFNGEQDLALVSAEKSVELFNKQKDEKSFVRSLALLRSLTQAGEEEMDESDLNP